jgi:hypothetical protein
MVSIDASHGCWIGALVNGCWVIVLSDAEFVLHILFELLMMDKADSSEFYWK